MAFSDRAEPMNPGDRAIEFIRRLTLTDDYAGKPFTLRPWQESILRQIFGTLREDGLRRYREALMMLARKQAKTQLCAAMGVFGLLGTGKEGQEIDCAASDRKQASHLYKKAVTMIEADRTLRKLVKIYSSSKVIEARKTGNVLQVLSAEGRRQHGLNPSIVLFDELHTQPDRELYNALSSAFGTRSEPLTLYISTAGNNRDSLCHDILLYARAVLADPSIDPGFLPIIYEAAADDDWTDERTWHKAMPALGDFCTLDFIRGEFLKAKASASEESKFRQLYLNQWVASLNKWLNREAWDRCGQTKFDPATLAGRHCFGGLDVSNTSDITGYVLVFPWDDGSFKVSCHFWIPRDYAATRDRSGATYLAWAAKGLITLTDGGYIDHAYIWEKVLQLAEAHDIRVTRIDPFQATQTAKHLMAEGMAVEFMRQGFLSMNEPTKYLEILLSKGKVHHGNNPVLTWMADNCVSERDAYGNIKLSKEKSVDKIDGMYGLVMALAGAMAAEPETDYEVIFI